MLDRHNSATNNITNVPATSAMGKWPVAGISEIARTYSASSSDKGLSVSPLIALLSMSKRCRDL